MAYTAIDDPEAYFQVVTWTGNATDDRTITLPADTDMQPDMVWAKERSSTSGHIIVDAVRGATKFIQSHNTTAEDTGADIVQSFETDGFEIGTHGAINEDTETYVAWCWKESATAGFDIVSHTGTGSARTQAHSLSAVPHVYITKRRSNTGNWYVYHQANGNTHRLRMDETSVAVDEAEAFNDTSPTSSVFSLGTSVDVNGSSETYITYAFAPVQGFSKFGSYTGNGSADGTFVYTGFRPAWVIVKSTASGAGWNIHDAKRDTYNEMNKQLYANSNAADGSSRPIDFLSNGFKQRGTTSDVNNSGDTFFYTAFAEAPFVNSNGVPCNAR